MRLALVVAVLVAGGPAQDDVVKKLVPDADKIKKLPKKISPQSRDKIEKALGEKLAEADLTPVLWECYSTVPRVSSMEKTRCLVTTVTVKAPKGPVRVGVAVAVLEKTVHVVRILDNQDDKALESRHFLSQFDGFEYSDLYGAPGALADALKKAQGSDEAAKEHDVVLRLNLLMHAMGPSWERMIERIEKKDKGASEEIDSMDKGFDESLKLLPAAKFFKATKQDKFKTFAVGARSDLAELKKMIDGGKFDDAFRRTGQLDQERCAKCHASYRNEFRTEREKRGLGNGFFSTKLEVAVPEPKLDASYQSVSTGIRKAILLATEAK
jgi:hypothetical protein